MFHCSKGNRCNNAVIFLLHYLCFVHTAGFAFPSLLSQTTRLKQIQQHEHCFWKKRNLLRANNNNDNNQNAFEDGEVGSGNNWIERSFPVKMGKTASSSSKNLKSIEDYNVGISGVSFGTGSLSKRMFDTIMSRTSIDSITDEIKRAFTIYAMDFTAKEAVRAALEQNGLQMVLTEEEEDVGMWGDVDSIRLLDPETNQPQSSMVYDDVEDAVDHWAPGQGFDFVARQVPAKLRELSPSELLQALDPDGSLREEISRSKSNSTLARDDDDDDY